MVGKSMGHPNLWCKSVEALWLMREKPWVVTVSFGRNRMEEIDRQSTTRHSFAESLAKSSTQNGQKIEFGYSWLASKQTITAQGKGLCLNPLRGAEPDPVHRSRRWMEVRNR